MVITPASRRACTPEELAFATVFGIAPHLASLLASMTHGQPVQALRKYIGDLRSALPTEAIDTTANGYQLTEIGQAECRKAISDFNAWINGRAA